MTLEEYIKRIVQKANVSQQDKEDLYFEIHDHLTSLKQEFIEQGKSEQAATQLAIQNFGEASTLGIEIDKAMQPPSQKYVRWLGWALFVPYSFVLFFKLLLGRYPYYFDSITLFLETGNWRDLNGLFNLTPFTTLLMYMTDFDHYNLDIILTNTIGNIVIFIPLGFLIPLLFRRINNVKLACKIFIKCIFLIELLQLLTFTGVFDIDDIILNTLGALIGYSTYAGMKHIWYRIKSVDKIDTI
ncbi:VanZ family protein [Bacillus cereus]|uniref:VanZ family protein n=1 Tax=Bacillus cereus TaxID=1396 RepID=A0AA44TG44_BACCE|nr:VanZ family protein [Bacillus cereus]PFN07921.1 VanZ family protein [Bacillus cereus]PFS06095.1 VanZ family protein [Bacillus cereus]